MDNVTFPSNGLTIAGHLHRPNGTPRGAVVVGHPGTGVKEQAAGLYARLLAEQGFLALAFDAAHQGESEGLPRGLEDPAQRVEDIRAAVTFLAAQDAGDVGVLGICASGGYGLAAASTDQRVKALATVSGVDIARQFRHGADGAQDPAVFQGVLAAAARSTGSFPLFPAEPAHATGHDYEGWEYYRTARGEHERSAKELTWSSIGRIAMFDAHAALGLYTRPLLLVVGEHAVTSWMAIDAFQKAQGPKELHRVEAATHVDLYDRRAPEAAAKVAEFFSGQLQHHLHVAGA
ncbi:alpha/beta hydrolase [Nocardia sp. NRRL S-836]|uniref:alpha/beta hydrolase n=1 Tax=Nocardia sp. NRRL S-836 TaxID=1519492 RepID=UPI0006AF0247|nr:alpha/beta hydrolase [Nocardia sp. NRRL S-836]KOV85113.1 DeoR faimly transcriptional regulator [Nocardia sp. NRRL S-836]